jgi:hypothetical protein
MARTNLAVTTLAQAGLIQPAGTAIDQANGMNIPIQSSAIPAAEDAYGLIIQVANTFAGTKTVTIRAGVQPPAFRNLLGDLVVSATTTSTWLIGPIEPARFAQADGSINVDFQAGITGTINAFLVPRSGI